MRLFETNNKDSDFLIDSNSLNGERLLLFKNSFGHFTMVSINEHRNPEIIVKGYLELDDFIKEKRWKFWEKEGIKSDNLKLKIENFEVWNE